MIRALFYLVLILVAVAVAVWVADRPGAVAITWQGYLVETSVGVLIATVAVVAVAAALLYRFWRALRTAPRRIAAARHARRRERGYRALTLGMVAVAAGDAAEAQRQARRADVLLDEPPLTRLLSAQTAQLEGDDKAAAAYFTAMLERPETAFLGLRGLIMQARRSGDRVQALAYAERANRSRPGTPWVLETLFDLQVRDARWIDAGRTLDSMRRAGMIDAAVLGHRRAVLALERSFAADRDGDRARALEHARDASRLDPALVPATAQLARLLADGGRSSRADNLIEQAWQREPHPTLARACDALHADEPALDHFKRFQALGRLRPDHAETRLALAEAALDARLWGEARAFLSDLIDDRPSARACRLMAAIETSENGDSEAARRWLERAAAADPDPAWVCGECGEVATRWSGLCPACGTFDSLRWHQPAHGPLLSLHGPDDPARPTLPAAISPEPARRANGAALTPTSTSTATLGG